MFVVFSVDKTKQIDNDLDDDGGHGNNDDEDGDDSGDSGDYDG